MSGVFVTGTDTDVGKTALSAALFHRYRPTYKLGYWKPVQTGFPEHDDTAMVRVLGCCPEEEIHAVGVRLPLPLSPHLAAGDFAPEIGMESLLRLGPAGGESSGGSQSWIVEGAGGVLVPLNSRQYIADLISALQLPALIAARSQLGTINHTLLTLEALKSRRIPVLGVVLIGETNSGNRRSIEIYGGVPVIGEMPRFAELTAGALAAWARNGLDPDSVLGSAFAETKSNSEWAAKAKPESTTLR